MPDRWKKSRKEVDVATGLRKTDSMGFNSATGRQKKCNKGVDSAIDRWKKCMLGFSSSCLSCKNMREQSLSTPNALPQTGG